MYVYIYIYMYIYILWMSNMYLEIMKEAPIWTKQIRLDTKTSFGVKIPSCCGTQCGTGWCLAKRWLAATASS